MHRTELFEHAADIVATGDVAGRITSVNRAAERLTGYSREDLVGEPFAKILAPEHLPLAAGLREIQVITSAGERIPVEISATDDGERGWLVIGRDLRGRHGDERARRMEAAARVARDIAHDFNNALLVTRGFGELIAGRLGEGEPARRHAEKIVAEANRAALMTRRLLAFSRPDPLQPEPLDLEAALASMVDGLRDLVGDGIEVAFRPAGDALPPVLADAAALRQIVQELVANARDALLEGGSVAIETQRLPGSYRLLRVSDAGAGMDAETLERAFDPFFTTKEASDGLGLAVVYGLVRQQGGEVEVESRAGEGTRVTVHLPEAEAAHPSE